MKHGELIEKFCHEQDHGKWMIWTEPVLGAKTDCEARPDILMISKSWANYEVRVLEVKVRQEDLIQDVRKLKFEKYFPWCHRISFVLGPGVKEDVLLQHPVGIIKYSKAGCRTKRAGSRLSRPNDFTKDWMMFHALNMGGNRFDFKMKIDRVRNAHEWLELADHKIKWEDRYKIKSLHLDKLIREAQSAMEKPENIIEKVRSQYRQEIKELIGAKGWKDIKSAKELMLELFRSTSQEFSDSLDKKFEDLLKEIMEVRVEEASA